MHRVPEPAVGERLGRVTSFRLVYPDRPQDAETLLVHPRTGRLYVVTKAVLGPSVVYEAPQRLDPAGRNVLRRVGEVDVPPSRTAGGPAQAGSFGRVLVTAGDIAPDGSRIALRTYTDLLEWPLGDRDVGKALEGTPTVTPLPATPQGEGLAYRADGRAVLTSSEGAGSPVHELAYVPVDAVAARGVGAGAACPRPSSRATRRGAGSPRWAPRRSRSRCWSRCCGDVARGGERVGNLHAPHPLGARCDEVRLRLRRGRAGHEGPARRQGRQPRRDDLARPSRPARLRHHDRGLPRLPGRRRGAGRAGCRGQRAPGGARGGDRQAAGRPGGPAAGQRAVRREVLDARDDGHRPQHRAERRERQRAGQAVGQRAVRVGLLPAAAADVRQDGAGRRGLRGGPGRGQDGQGHQERPGPGRGGPARPGRPVQGRWCRTRPGSRSRRTRARR